MTEFFAVDISERATALAMVAAFFLVLAGTAALSIKSLWGETAPIRLFRMIGRTAFAPAVLAEENVTAGLGEAVGRCLNCRYKVSCDRWLAEAPATALAPTYCPNRAFLQRLAG